MESDNSTDESEEEIILRGENDDEETYNAECLFSQASTLHVYMVNKELSVWNVINGPTKTVVVKKQISHTHLVKKKRKNEFQQKTNWVSY